VTDWPDELETAVSYHVQYLGTGVTFGRKVRYAYPLSRSPLCSSSYSRAFNSARGLKERCWLPSNACMCNVTVNTDQSVAATSAFTRVILPMDVQRFSCGQLQTYRQEMSPYVCETRLHKFLIHESCWHILGSSKI